MHRQFLKFGAFLVSLTVGVATASFLIPEKSVPRPGEQEISGVEGNEARQSIQQSEPQDTTLQQLDGRREDLFADETSVGRPGKNKLVIRCYEDGGKAFAQINFYFLSNTRDWKMRIKDWRIEKDPIAICDPQVKDFNNDG